MENNIEKRLSNLDLKHPKDDKIDYETRKLRTEIYSIYKNKIGIYK